MGGLDPEALDQGLEVPAIRARSERMVVVFGLEPSGCFSLCIVLSIVSVMPGWFSWVNHNSCLSMLHDVAVPIGIGCYKLHSLLTGDGKVLSWAG